MLHFIKIIRVFSSDRWVNRTPISFRRAQLLCYLINFGFRVQPDGGFVTSRNM
jgi:hypothetical protein